MSKLFLYWGIFLGGAMLTLPLSAAQDISTESALTNSADTAEDGPLNPDSDPFQRFNRAMFQIHTVLDGILMEPMANVYQDATPRMVKNRIGNFLNNIKEPWTLINDGLQGESEKGLETFSRFMINTVFGLFGLFDVAGSLGLNGHQSNFGQTLGAWGVPAGPYIFVPVLGPHSLRSLVGRLVGVVADPYNMTLSHAHRGDVIWTTIFIDGLVKRADSIPIVEDIRENSLDYYIGMRSSFLQYEQGQLNDQANTLQPNPEDFLSD